MRENNKFYILKCNKCLNEVKVSPQEYRDNKKIVCNNCLDKLLKSFKNN